MRCLWAGRDSHLRAGADLDCFGIAYGHFGGVRLLQIRALNFRKTAKALGRNADLADVGLGFRKCPHYGSNSPQRCRTEFGLALAVIDGAVLPTAFNQFAPSFGGWLPMVRSEP